MPFSSLFNRRGSRKNQSKNTSGETSKQNDPSASGNIKQVCAGENCPRKNEVLHEDFTSQQQLEVEGKICPAVSSNQAQPEASNLQNTQDENTGERTMPCDIQSETVTNSENNLIRPKEDDVQVKVKSAENLNSENMNLCDSGSSQHNDEFIDEKESCPDVNVQEHQNSVLTHSACVPTSQNSGTNAENQEKTKICIAEQCECVSEELTASDESTELKVTDSDAHENATEEMISNVSQEAQHWEDNGAVNDSKPEILNVKNEEMQEHTCDQKDTLNTSSHPSSPVALEFSNEESIAFVETSKPKEEEAKEAVVNVLASPEPVEAISSVVADTHKPKSEGVVTSCSDHTNSDLLTKTAPENSADIYSQDLSSENKSATDYTVSYEHRVSDSQNISDSKQSDAAETEETSGPHCSEHVFEETSTKTDIISEKNDKEHRYENFPEKREQDIGIENSIALEIQAEFLDANETPKETDYATEECRKSANTEEDTTEVQNTEKVLAPSHSATNISEISDVVSTEEKNENETTVDIKHENKRNSTDKEGTEAKLSNDQDSHNKPEILENDPNLTTDEREEINSPRDFTNVPIFESQSSVEDSLDSFPSECEDFLGGQRTLLAAEQHPPPSWKVGYLQVKLPAKSRGRGKLKVWRQRWVVIQMDEFVKDTKNPSLIINIYASECSNARRHSSLFWCAVSASKTVVYRSQSKTHKYAFSISVDNDVVLHLAADSETASQEWMASIRNLLWPPNPVLELEKVLHGSDFEVSVIDNEFSFHAGLLGTYGNMKVTSTKLIFSHSQTDHVIQEWYLNTLDRFQLLPQCKEADAFKIVVMHTGVDSSTGSGQIILFCSEAVTMLQCVASTIHKLLQYKTNDAGKDHYQKELSELAEWLPPAIPPSSAENPTEDYYKVPPRLVRSLLDIPKFSFEKPLSNEGFSQNPEPVVTKPSMLTSATSASTFSEDSGISMAIHPDDFLNCSITSFTIGGRPVRDHTSSESSDGYSPPCSPEMQRKEQETDAT